MDEAPFWRVKPLRDMSAAEWESLCDGCGKCCLVRLEDEDSGQIVNTAVACRLFQRTSCRCSDYENRNARVPTCVVLSPDTVSALAWMPQTCAYRLLAQGEDLPPWHHLVSGSRETIHEAGMSVRDRTISEDAVSEDALWDHVMTWPGEEDGA